MAIAGIYPARMFDSARAASGLKGGDGSQVLVEALARVRGWSRRRQTTATMATIGCYVVFSGAGSAALRRVMVGAGLLLSRDGGRSHSFALLGLCAALLLAIAHALATDVGFQLSRLGTGWDPRAGAPDRCARPGHCTAGAVRARG